MGDYSQRERELTGLLGEFTGPPDEVEQIRPRITEYLTARRRRLDDLVDAVSAIATGAEDALGKWQTPTSGLTEDAARILGGLLESIREPSAAAIALKWRIQNEEERFIRQLRELNTGAYFGQLVPMLREVREMDKSLRARYAGLIDKGRSIDEAQGARCEQLKATLVQLRADSSARLKDLTERLRAGASELAKLREGSEAPDWYQRVGRGSTTVTENLNRALEQMSEDSRGLLRAIDAVGRELAVLRSLQEAELSGLHHLFHEARKETESFARTPAPERAKDKVQNGRDLLARWASGLPTSGQQSDGAALAKELGERMAPAVQQVEQAWQEFLREHEGRFLRGISSTTIEVLGRPSGWAARRDALAGFPALLAELRAQVEAIPPGHFDPLYLGLVDAAQIRLGAVEKRLASAEEYRRTLEDRHNRARAELLHYLPLDSDLDAFILDYNFTDAANHLSYDLPSDLARSDKMNVLFERYGAETVLAKARSIFEVKTPFDERDIPTKRHQYVVSDSDREVLLNILKDDSELDALAIDHFRQAYNEFTSGMPRRRKAALLLSHFPASDVLARAHEVFSQFHPFDDRDLPTKRREYSVSESDRDALLKLLATQAEIDGFAVDFARRAYGDFKSGMSLRQKAALILAYHGSDTIKAAQNYYYKIHPFDDRDNPTRPGGYPIRESDRDLLVRSLRTDSDLTAFALDYFRHAATDFTNSMTTTQKAALLLYHYGSDKVLEKLREILKDHTPH